jgi:hypothetical protein
MAGKITRGVLFAFCGLALALFAAFIYINNDLGSANLARTFEKEFIGKLPVVPGNGDELVEEIKVDESDVTVSESDAELDAVFDTDEMVDNFDDLVE